MRRTYRLFLSCFLLVTLIAGGGLAGCADISESGGQDPPPEQKEIEPAPQNGKIVHAEDPCTAGNTGESQPCYLQATTHTEVPLKAKVLQSGGEPAAKRLVKYEVVEQDQGLLSIRTKRAVTQESGVAEIQLLVDDETTGTGTIKAYTENEALGAIYWEVDVRLKGGGEYKVDVSYDGQANLGRTEVGIYDSSKSCEQLRDKWAIRRKEEFNQRQLPTKIFAKEQPLTPAQDDTLKRTVFFGANEIETGKSYTVWVRSFKHRPDGSDEPPVELAWGCSEDNGTMQPQKTVEVKVDLRDHLPRLREKYTVKHNFDLVGALPDNVENAVRLLGLFVRSPGAFVTGCKPGDTLVKPEGGQVELCPNGEVSGVIDFLADLSFLPESIQSYADQITENDAVRESVRSVIDAFIVDKLFENIPWAQSARQISDDIYSTVTQFGVKGEMQFMTQPSPTYGDGGEPQMTLPKDGTKQVWQQFSFYWANGKNCEDAQDFQSCRTGWFDAQEFLSSDDRFIEGNFEAHMGGANALHISEHSLRLNFGALVIGALEQVVLPRYFSDVGGGDNVVKDVDENGDGTVTFQELLGGTLVDCKSIADSDTLGKEDGKIEGSLEQAVYKLCGQFQQKIVERFKTAIKDRLSLENATVTIKSPDGEPCTLHQPAPYPGQPEANAKLPYIEKLGTAEKTCSWKVNISFAADEVEGEFYGSSE